MVYKHLLFLTCTFSSIKAAFAMDGEKNLLKLPPVPLRSERNALKVLQPDLNRPPARTIKAFLRAPKNSKKGGQEIISILETQDLSSSSFGYVKNKNDFPRFPESNSFAEERSPAFDELVNRRFTHSSLDDFLQEYIAKQEKKDLLSNPPQEEKKDSPRT